MKAIPTFYNGTLFRSRTEARWAVLLDALSIPWVYEPEGYQLPSLLYLPDFWLPRFECFAEVKPLEQRWDDEAMTKVRELSLCSRRCVLLLDRLDIQEHQVRVLVPQPDVGETLRLWADIPESVVRGRLWYEFSDPHVPIPTRDSSWLGDWEDPPLPWPHLNAAWGVAVERAKNYQFRRAA